MTYRWLTPLSQHFLEKDYLLPGQTVDERVNIICNKAEEILGIKGYSDKLKDYFSRGWYSFSTPIWTNFGSNRGLPISCFGSQIEDSMESIVDTWSEVSIMTKYGGGTSAYFGNIRSRGSNITNNGKSSGAVHFMKAFDSLINIINQGSTRRGNFAAYLPIDHNDIEEFLSIKSEGHPIQDLSFGICVEDKWLNEMISGDSQKRRIWAKVIESRTNTGYPYIFFTDNANNNKPECYKNIKITHSNLCAEINLPDSSDESFVCDLSSLNMLYWEEWKNTDAVEVLVYFLDAVMSEFIDKASNIKHLKRAAKFATRHRALGIGWLGWHSLLQSKMIPFESMEAKYLNVNIAQNIKEKAYEASKKLGHRLGVPEICKGTGRRNATLLAIAPTKSSSFIIGQVSEGIEPFKSNYYIKDLAKGKFSIKNPDLIQLLEKINKNTDEVWNSILQNGGSVQHLNFLSENEKNVFKTFSEISPKEVIIQASQRQKYIDQGQSLNLMIHPSTPTKEINSLILEAWKLGIKSLYYQQSINAAQTFSRNLLNCVSCES